MISVGEINFFEQIKDNCKIIFDIGCRTDIDYSLLSKNKVFYLFEPNPRSYEILIDKINTTEVNEYNTIYPFNIGLGKEKEVLDYYVNSESFFPRFKDYGKSIPIKLKIFKFSTFLHLFEIEKIDFLKIDTEGYESDILLDNPDFLIKNVKYVQFEYASTWIDRGSKFNIFDIYDLFSKEFWFYFLFDEKHPISKEYKENLTPIENKQMLQKIEDYMLNQYGFNIVMMNKKILS